MSDGTWAGLAGGECPSYQEMIDADTTNEVQLAGASPPPGWSTDRNLASPDEIETNFNGNGVLGTNPVMENKSAIEAWRTWDCGPNGDAPVMGALSWNSTGCAVNIPWTNDPDVPTWAESQIEVVLYRADDVGGLPGTWAELQTDTFNGSSMGDGTAAANTKYHYKLEYRNTIDPSLTGPDSNTDSILTGTCDGGPT